MTQVKRERGAIRSVHHLGCLNGSVVQSVGETPHVGPSLAQNGVQEGKAGILDIEDGGLGDTWFVYRGAQVLKQDGFGRGVIVPGPVVIQVLVRDVGYDGDIELAGVHTALMQAVRGAFEHGHVAASGDHLGQVALRVWRIGCRAM